MFARILVTTVMTLVVAACRSAPEPRQYELNGQILAIEPTRNEVTIKHEDIKNFMPGMTMPFRVRDAALLDGKAPGDLVTATLVVGEVEAHLSTLTKTGHATLEIPLAQPAVAVLQPGDPVEDRTLIDQNGSAVAFSTWRGHRVALTFMYTRCPLPEFCPRMDRQFATLQQELAKRPELSDVRLISMTLDPAFDTPAVLKTHAQRLRANPAVWSFLSGKPVEANEFATQFGIYVEQDPESAINITHNLRTAIIDADGRLVKVHTGNEWTPADLVADLTATPAPQH